LGPKAADVKTHHVGGFRASETEARWYPYAFGLRTVYRTLRSFSEPDGRWRRSSGKRLFRDDEASAQ
jgi:hypothetical protein